MATVDTAPADLARSTRPAIRRARGSRVPPAQPRTSPAEAHLAQTSPADARRRPRPLADTPQRRRAPRPGPHALLRGHERREPRPDPTTLIGSVQRAMRLLEAVAAREHGAPAKQLAREAGLALPTAYHLLRTLAHEGYLRREKGLFFLGEAAERLSSSGAQQKRRSTMSDALAHWRDSIGVPVYYAVVPRRRDRGHVRRRHPGQSRGRGVGRLPRDRARPRDRPVSAVPARREGPPGPSRPLSGAVDHSVHGA